MKNKTMDICRTKVEKVLINNTIQYTQSPFPTPIIPNLVALQYGSFQNFLLTGLIESFQDINPIICQYGQHTLKIQFFPEKIQFRKIENSDKSAIHFGTTYGCSIYIPALISSTEWHESKMEWLSLGFLPLMTKAGSFIINGVSRVVLHQMVRNPGVYILSKDSRTKSPTIRIVPEQGSWVNITIDKKNKIWVTTRVLRRKISVLIFLQALGFSLQEIENRIEHLNILDLSFIKPLKYNEKTRHGRILEGAGLKNHPKTQNEAQRYIYAHIQEYTSAGRDYSISNETAYEFFNTVVWNPKLRNLGPVGREQFRQKFGNSLGHFDHLLNKEDMMCSTQALLELVSGERQSDDIDSLNNKRVRGCGDFLADQFSKGLKEFEILLIRKLNLGVQSDSQTIWKLQKSTLPKLISKSWKTFFTSGTLSQFLDETNPLSELTHKRRITVLGPGGVSSKQTTIQIRGIHPTYYGRLCPIETPEGKNAGLVSSLTIFARPNYLGHLETPFYKVYKGQVQKFTNPKYYVSYQESNFLLAPADITVNETLTFSKNRLPIRKDWNFDYGRREQITNQSINILQMISVATSLIPFLEHDDANRALMGSNMQRQAVPLVESEAPYVQTGLESRVISDTQHSLHASSSSYVTAISASNIRLYLPKLKNTKSKFLNFNASHNELGKEYIPLISNPLFYFDLIDNSKNLIFNTKESVFYTELPYYNSQTALLTDFLSKKLSNKKSLQCKFRSIYKNKKIGPKIFQVKKQENYHSLLNGKTKNQSDNFKLDELCNINLSHFEKPWYRKKNQLCFTVEDFKPEYQKNKKDSNTFHTSLERYQRTNQSTCKLHQPIVSEGEWISKSDILADGAASVGGKISLGKNIIVAYLPWEGYNFEDAILISDRLVRDELFTSLHIDYYEIEIKNTQYGLETITNQVPMEVTDSDRDMLRVRKLEDNGVISIGTWVQEGDYLVGKITPMNPKGPSVQQQYEKLYNVIMQRENTHVRNTSLRVPKGVEGFIYDVHILPPTEADVIAIAPKDAVLRVRIALLQRRNIQVGDKMAGRHGNKGIVSKILPEYDMPYLPDGTPIDIVLNPLGVPSRMNVGQILECLLGFAGRYLKEAYTIPLFDEQSGSESSRSFVFSKLLEASIKTNNPWIFEPHHPGKMKLFDGRTGNTFDQAITVGCTYMLKLVHLVDDKLHSRATGPYSAITQQPVRGRSRNGGQRLGEMEVWALQAYGAAAILQELLTIKSDDVSGRKQAVFQIYTNNSIQFGPPESFRILIRELQALCFNLNIFTRDKKYNILKRINLKYLEKLGKFENEN